MLRTRLATTLLGMLAMAQQQQAPQAPARGSEPASFRSKVNLVLVPVVVRDKKGVAIGTLKKEDFELSDKGKAQTIVKFSVEKAGSTKVEFEPEPAPETPGVDPEAPALPVEPAERYTAFLFDDLHLGVGDLAQARVAAEKHLVDGIPATERVAVFSTSGHVSQKMTGDRDKIITAIRAIRPVIHPTTCPSLPYAMVRAITREDQQAYDAAVAEAKACAGLQSDPSSHDPSADIIAKRMVANAVDDITRFEETNTRLTLDNLRSVVRMLATMPGQRILLYISPGFFAQQDYHNGSSDVIELAIRGRVVINSLNAAGLNTGAGAVDVSYIGGSATSIGLTAMYGRLEVTEGSLMLSELADGTGGRIFENSNDDAAGFRKLTKVPEYTYILGFSPENLKPDGSLHTIKVKLRSGGAFTIQARRGYYAPKGVADPAAESKREVTEAVFSRDVVRDLPVELRTQYFKSGEYEARLGVMARIDLTPLRFKKQMDGRNKDNLTLVAALFDASGNFVKGERRDIDMNLKDDLLQDKTRSTVTIKINFDVKIGSYVVRLVVRDSEGQLMAAQNGSVVIP